MPKYTTSKLEIYLKQDSKKIKKHQSSLKNADILNFLSTLLGYKNYQEVSNRKNDKTLINLVDLSLSKLNEIRESYTESIESKYSIKYFYSNLENILPIKKLTIKNNNKTSSVLNLSDYKTVLKMDNDIFVNFSLYSLYLLLEDETILEYKITNLLNIVFDIMKDLNVTDYQNEIKEYLSYDDIKKHLKVIKNNDLKRQIEEYIQELEGSGDPYEVHGYYSHFIAPCVFHPYVDTTTPMKKNYNKVINVSELMKGLPDLEVMYHDKNDNYKILKNLFDIQFNYFTSKELPIEYKEALAGFKSQSKYALDKLKGKKGDISKSHNLLNKNKRATMEIYKILMTDKDINIDNLNENKLFEILSSDHPFYLSHLKKNPIYYSAYNIIDNIEYYFITTYYNDAMSFGGHASNLDDVLMMFEKSRPQDSISTEKCPTELKATLIKPELASNFYVKPNKEGK